jgi:hypothetical protein
LRYAVAVVWRCMISPSEAALSRSSDNEIGVLQGINLLAQSRPTAELRSTSDRSGGRRWKCALSFEHVLTFLSRSAWRASSQNGFASCVGWEWTTRLSNCSALCAMFVRLALCWRRRTTRTSGAGVTPRSMPAKGGKDDERQINSDEQLPRSGDDGRHDCGRNRSIAPADFALFDAASRDQVRSSANAPATARRRAGRGSSLPNAGSRRQSSARTQNVVAALRKRNATSLCSRRRFRRTLRVLARAARWPQALAHGLEPNI